jgi:dipeptidyl aminopeptidase/acylaminoacyl peptidase
VDRPKVLKLAPLIGLTVGVIALASACGGGGQEGPAPTATGRIAYTSRRDGNDEIYVMNADGSDRTNLSNNPAQDDLAAWSPDGSRIAFTSDRDGNWEI